MFTDDSVSIGASKVVLEDRIECVWIFGLRDNHRGQLDGIEVSFLDLSNLLIRVVVLLYNRSTTLV